jgi:hypothetical protein
MKSITEDPIVYLAIMIVDFYFYHHEGLTIQPAMLMAIDGFNRQIQVDKISKIMYHC